MKNNENLANDSASEVSNANWKEIVSAWQSSGLTRKDFCEQRQINYHQFLYQRCKYGQKSKPVLPEWLSVQQSEKKLLPPPTLGIAPLATGFLLKTPRGHQLSIPAGADTPTLKILLAFMGESTC